MTDDSGQQAVRWMIALQDNPDDEIIVRDFMAWLQQSQVNKEAWSALEISRSMALAAREADEPTVDYQATVDPEITPALANQGSAPERQRQRLSLQVAAAIAASLLAYAFGPYVWLMLSADHLTNAGQVATITLPDQSVVRLGGSSAIAIDFSESERAIELLAGEAYFEVKRDTKARPFVVKSEMLRARVAGTSFEVLRRSAGASVAVLEGQVMVHTGNSTTRPPVALKAGEAITEAYGGKLSQKLSVERNRIASWRDGLLYVEDQPLTNVLDVLDRYHQGTIVRAAWKLESVRVTGVFDLKRPADTLRLIAASSGLHVRRVGAGIDVLSAY